jgi:hypothetical protein
MLCRILIGAVVLALRPYDCGEMLLVKRCHGFVRHLRHALDA